MTVDCGNWCAEFDDSVEVLPEAALDPPVVRRARNESFIMQSTKPKKGPRRGSLEIEAEEAENLIREWARSVEEEAESVALKAAEEANEAELLITLQTVKEEYEERRRQEEALREELKFVERVNQRDMALAQRALEAEKRAEIAEKELSMRMEARAVPAKDLYMQKPQTTTVTPTALREKLDRKLLQAARTRAAAGHVGPPAPMASPSRLSLHQSQQLLRQPNRTERKFDRLSFQR